jgi:hypothetical protein
MVEEMSKIVGKFFILLFGLVVNLLDARIFMEIRTDNGARNQVVVGQPFTLDVVIDDVYGAVQVPIVKGLKGFVARQSGSYMSSINGRSTARYSYQVRIDTLGSYVLGPAVITHQQKELVSNELRVDVVKDVGISHNSNNQAVEQKAFLRLMVDSESVVVGQKIGCTLRFYYQDQSLSLSNVGMPTLSGFEIQEIGKLEQGTAEVDGVEYHYAQWRWDMYPTKPGEFIIPAYNADYEIPAKDNHMFGGFFVFVNSRADRKRVYSNAVTIKVSSLPYCNHPVHAVGTFERFSAEIKPGMAKQGEGMVLVMEIEGDGNLQAIAVPSLQLPKALKYYDSNNAIIPSQYSDEFPKKRFEFIVQGMECGDCEIPEQRFTYFDTERNAYTTLRTSPLAVSIMPGAHSVKKDTATTTASIEQDSVSVVVEEGIADINTIGEWYPVAERQPLPWWIFQLLFLLPCVYIGYPRILEKLVVLGSSNARFMRRRAFKKARKQIDHAIKKADAKSLYAIFIQLFQELGTQPDSEEWSSFFGLITHAAYAQSDDNDSYELCRMAKQWLERLEKSI